MKCLSLALYLGLAAIANADPALEALRTGDMRRLNFHAEPRAVPDAAFYDPSGEAHTLSDYAGRHLLVNFWGLWCAPCRVEMPALDALQRTLGSEDFEVVTLAVWRNPVPGIESFFEEEGITALPILLDPDRSVSRAMGVVAQPITVLIDPEGREVARMQGEADWSGPDARALLEAWIAG